MYQSQKKDLQKGSHPHRTKWPLCELHRTSQLGGKRSFAASVQEVLLMEKLPCDSSFFTSNPVAGSLKPENSTTGECVGEAQQSYQVDATG